MNNKYKDCIGYQEGVIPSSSNRIEFSLIELFGQIPVHPDKFDKLDPRLKWFGKCTEGESFCAGCGTLTPSDPTTHHPGCGHYLSPEYVKEMEDYKQRQRGSQEARDKVLDVKIDNGILSIQVGLDSLSRFVQTSDYWPDEDYIGDSLEFATDIVGRLSRNGSELDDMFDKVAMSVLESGCLGITYGEEDG